MTTAKPHRICTTSVASVYSHDVRKAERKGRTKAEVDEKGDPLPGQADR